MNYILAVDFDKDVREVYEMILKRSFPLEIVLTDSYESAYEVLKIRGAAELIILEHEILCGDVQSLLDKIAILELNIPFVVCSQDRFDMTKYSFPQNSFFIEKSKFMDSIVDVAAKAMTRNLISQGFVPIRISILRKWGMTPCDLYMKLSEERFVKVINGDEYFSDSENNRFETKGLTLLYLTKSDSEKFLISLDDFIDSSMEAHVDSSSGLLEFVSETIEMVEKLSRVLGWTPQVIQSAKSAVMLAQKAMLEHPDIFKIIKDKLNSPSSKYAKHVSLVTLLGCGLSQELGWSSKSTHLKIGLAALLHDLSLDESCYEQDLLWRQNVCDRMNLEPDAVKFRNHPIEAAELLKKMKMLPPDVDQIILQHHEMCDGSGFPKGLNASRISPLASVFIFAEDLLNSLEDYNNIEEGIYVFLKHRKSRYKSGTFLKIFNILEQGARLSRV